MILQFITNNIINKYMKRPEVRSNVLECFLSVTFNCEISGIYLHFDSSNKLPLKRIVCSSCIIRTAYRQQSNVKGALKT